LDRDYDLWIDLTVNSSSRLGAGHDGVFFGEYPSFGLMIRRN
jgi:hypothetical protein